MSKRQLRRARRKSDWAFSADIFRYPGRATVYSSKTTKALMENRKAAWYADLYQISARQIRVTAPYLGNTDSESLGDILQ
jgi:hypothetical protein